MATILDTRRHFFLTLWDIWGPVVWGWGDPHKCGSQSLPLLLSWLAPKADLGRRQQGSEFVGGWIGASPASSQFEWEGDNLFF